jgi:hypothetical protein
MTHDHYEAIQIDARNLWAARSYFESVGISIYRSDGSQHSQLVQQVSGAYVTRVQDMVNLAKGLKHLWAQQTVRV